METIQAGLCCVWKSCQNGFLPVFVALLPRLTVFLASFPALRAAQRAFMLAASLARPRVQQIVSLGLNSTWG
jgi:hypothetical protein